VAKVALNSHPKDAHFKAVQRFLNAAMPLPDFITSVSPLWPKQRAVIVNQAIMLLENCYAHLPLKSAMYAIDPVRRLRLLRHRLAQFGSKPSIKSDLSFHGEMIDIFTSLRDLHTRYFLPDPFPDATAFLPFDVEAYLDRGKRKYIATHFARWQASAKLAFRPGVEVLHWNGIPIAHAVEIAGRQSAGNNPAARLANGLMRLTKRPLGTVSPPDEQWVFVGYRTDNEVDEIRVEWHVLPALPLESAVKLRRKKSMLRDLSVAHEIDHVRRARKLISAPHIVVKSARMSAVTNKTRLFKAKTDTMMVDYFRAEEHQARGGRGKFGYIRIFRFPEDDPDSFVREFTRLVTLLPENGLIIDIRDNPGGKIVAAERLLQLLTSRRPIEPQRLYFINSPVTLKLCQLQAKDYDLASWIPSMQRSVETGATFSASFPINSAPNYCNELEQAFRGPIVLVTNALSYSAAEFFAAGFQDHRIGTILGIDDATGAAGAHVKDYGSLRQFFNRMPPFTEPLPKQSQMTIALRRSVRVGTHVGTEVEDFGVTPDVLYEMTRRDLLESNTDLMEYAAGLLAAMTVKTKATSDGVGLDITTHKIKLVGGASTRINEIDILVDWHLKCSKTLTNQRISLTLGPSAEGRSIEIHGYIRSRGSSRRQLIAVRRV
jgi:C-terminal processing protease CtpA/Prc